VNVDSESGQYLILGPLTLICYIYVIFTSTTLKMSKEGTIVENFSNHVRS
jgi:hypothetical protein